MNVGPGPYQNFATPLPSAPREAEDYQPNEASGSKGGLPPIVASTKPDRSQQKFHNPSYKARRGKPGKPFAAGPSNWRFNRQHGYPRPHDKYATFQASGADEESQSQSRRPRTGRPFDPRQPRRNTSTLPYPLPPQSRPQQSWHSNAPNPTHPNIPDTTESQEPGRPQSVTPLTGLSTITASYQRQSNLKHVSAHFRQEREALERPQSSPDSVPMGLQEEEEDIKPRIQSPSPLVMAEKAIPIVKSEEPLPTAPPEKTLITSGSERYFPLPDNCIKDPRNSNWQKYRQTWVRGKCNDLKARGLRIDRCFIRDDGMVIDWSSDVPVWSDTLLTPREPSSPTPSLSLLDILPVESSSRATSPDPDVSIVAAHQPKSGALRQSSPSPVTHPVARYSAREHEDIQEMTQDLAIRFLERYSTTFDSNRACIHQAYDEEATLTCWCPNELSPDAFTGLVQGPDRVQHALSSMPPCISFSDIDYNLVFLGSRVGPQPEVMLTVQNGWSDHRGPSLVATHVFLLRRPSHRPATVWPLEICSHQVVVRDGQWIDPHRGQSEAFVGI